MAQISNRLLILLITDSVLALFSIRISLTASPETVDSFSVNVDFLYSLSLLLLATPEAAFLCPVLVKVYNLPPKK